MHKSPLIRFALPLLVLIVLLSCYKMFLYRNSLSDLQGNIEYEDSYVNAKAFRNEFIRVRKLDSMFLKDSSQKKFIFQRVKILRNTPSHIEAIALPQLPRAGNYYLILDDSIFQMSPLTTYRK